MADGLGCTVAHGRHLPAPACPCRNARRARRGRLCAPAGPPERRPRADPEITQLPAPGSRRLQSPAVADVRRGPGGEEVRGDRVWSRSGLLMKSARPPDTALAKTRSPIFGSNAQMSVAAIPSA